MYDDITLSITASIKKSTPIHSYFYHVNPSNNLIQIMVPSEDYDLHHQACHIYVIISRSLTRDIHNAILCLALTMAYKILHKVITEYYG